jgi:hypothetical protein
MFHASEKAPAQNRGLLIEIRSATKLPDHVLTRVGLAVAVSGLVAALVLFAPSAVAIAATAVLSALAVARG